MATPYLDFELRCDERQLIVRGHAAPIGARAFDLLVALAERSERVVGKHELLDIVWPQLVVEENNLQVQIHALRKLLGASAITTVPGRGYRFTAELAPQQHQETSRGAGSEEESLVALFADRADGNMPHHIPALYGREAAVAALRSMVEAERLVMVTGASGIGKTCVAQAVGHQLRDVYAGGVWMVELATVTEPDQVVAAVAHTLGVPLAGRQQAIQALTAALRAQSVLIVLDNCEHMVEAVGQLVSDLLAGAPEVRLLTTSQEVLRVPQEQVYKLAPLPVPSEGDTEDPCSFAAVQLFVERARSLDRSFALDARNVHAVIEVCRSLDGIPLAIELAAARVPGLGVYALHERIGERFRLLTGGARLSLPRHQTLRAALDWSHNLLGDEESLVFRRLAVFAGSFSVEGAQSVCSDAEIDKWAVLDILSALVDKSLVLVDASMRPRYRYLESTRAYAMEKLAEAGETNDWLKRHAQSTRTICEAATRQRDVDWMWAEMNNVRVAYVWAIGPEGDPVVAVALATVSAMVLAVGGLVDEAMQRLLQVEPLVNASTPPALAARFWQWLGRGGLEGRLPTSRCLQALDRAEAMFRSLGNLRHVHACLRMRAEAMVASGELVSAATALHQAKSMECGDGLPSADRMRRLRVQGMLAAASARHDESHQMFRSALQMAQTDRVQRYELILLADIARVHLDQENFADAAALFKLLAEKAKVHPSQGLTRAQAIAGLVAALVGQGKPAQAVSAAVDGVPLLRRCGILLAHGDIYAWLFASTGQHAAAARLIGATDAFHQQSETSRDSVKRLARAEVMRALSGFAFVQVEGWMGDGAHWDELLTANVLEATLTALAATMRVGRPSTSGDALVVI